MAVPPEHLTITLPRFDGEAMHFARIPVMEIATEDRRTGERRPLAAVVADVVQRVDRPMSAMSIVVSVEIPDPSRPTARQPKLGYAIHLEDIAHAIMTAVNPLHTTHAKVEYRTREENEAAIQVALGAMSAIGVRPSN